MLSRPTEEFGRKYPVVQRLGVRPGEVEQ